MPPKRPVCSFHSKHASGCRFGSACKFLHIGPPGMGAAATQTSAATSPRSPPKPGGAPSNNPGGPGRPEGSPPGSCNDFWLNGECDRGFDCRYKHIRPNETQRPLPIQAGEPLNPFVEDNAFEKISAASDVFSLTTQSLTPTDAHNHLRTFLRDGYEFRSSQNMHSFGTVLSSANSESSSWQLSEGQSFLSLVAKPGGNGVLLMGKVLRHERVSTRAGGDRNTLSFQRGYLPLFTYLSSDFVIKSTMHHDVNSLYSIVDINFDRIAEVITQCMNEFTAARSFADPQGGPTIPGTQVFRAITTVLMEYIARYKHAVSSHQTFGPLAHLLSEAFKTWEQGVRDRSWQEAISDLPPRGIDFLLQRLRQGIETLVDMVDMAEGGTFRRQGRATRGQSSTFHGQGLLASLDLTYDGPSDERPEGPRHDNDHTNISDIRIAPTHGELTCEIAPYLPANIPGAPHHLPNESMARLVDIQFRLLREELIAPIKSAISMVLEDLNAEPGTATQLNEIVKKKGGLYKGSRHSSESVTFSLYTNIQFDGLECDHRHGLSVNIAFDTPSGRARNADSSKRVDYWETVGRKRLIQGGLVALIWRKAADPSDVKIYLGVVSSTLEFLTKSAKNSPDDVHIKVSFFDQQVEFQILQSLQKHSAQKGDTRLLVEAPVMFESIRPFLETIQRTNPSLVPFSRYLAHPKSGTLKDIQFDPPLFATRPGVTMDLSSLLEPEAPLTLNSMDPDSAQLARDELKERSRLDPSQADAIVDCLTKEIALIQGPPGTGKSYTGVELIRVLIANKVRPIVLIAFTNHALDHLLSNVVEAGITRKIVRLGSRSKDEQIAEFSLEKVLALKAQDKSQSNKSVRSEFRLLKITEESMKKLMEEILAKDVKTPEMEPFLAIRYPDHLQEIARPPLWISELFENQKGWSNAAASLLDFWRRGGDLDFIAPPAPKSTAKSKDKKGKKKADTIVSANMFAGLPGESNEAGGAVDEATAGGASGLAFSETPDPVAVFFNALNLPGVPPVPTTDRPVAELSETFLVWKMSRVERKKIFQHWTDEVRVAKFEKQEESFRNLRQSHADARARHENAINQTRLDVLKNADLIGCTTNGAAKLTSLLTSLQPRVLLVEEAGQVLEAHILASLVPSVESMVLIGDPQQLRPTLANYNLSMDNPRTGKVYKFDQSLMERLSSMGLHMSQLEVQRRMRPAISNLIRKTLYPNLQDHERVSKYPDVRGLAKNVFFLSHDHAEEGGGEDSVSKTNSFEVAMIKDLVMHLLRQGTYSGEGSIVVLCAYLGQLVKIYKELSKLVATVIDERDQDQLVDYEDNQEVAGILPKTTAEQLKVTKRVIVRTVDNFQGEEADVVILSLVRNSGKNGTSRKGGIGFLKSENRSNVALSRARQGLFILGNADDLSSRSKMWRSVVEELRQNDQIGDGFPISCTQHPENVTIVKEPGMIVRIAPDGGCLIPCGAQLQCGHQCPWKCHSDDPEHVSVKCLKPCQRLCPRLHACRKRCSEGCGQCRFQVEYTLPGCGHTNLVLCHQLDHPETIVCRYPVLKRIPGCEHTAVVDCGMDPAQYVCQSRCDLPLPCCGKPCAAECAGCQGLNTLRTGAEPVPRQIHARHPCTKPLHCQHLCGGECSLDHDCSLTVCQERCRQKCSHRACTRPCADPCPPCVEPVCEWQCDHVQCPVACGSVCARVPCDRRCSKALGCGHRCPSVCGEDCDTQICPLCASTDVNSQVVDLIMGATMGQIDPHGEDLDEILITLSCRHVFTAETLDGTCELHSYYTQTDGVWTGLAQPPQGLQKPPVCPTCRAPVTARRYGRVWKRANLDMLEHHIGNSSRLAIRHVLDMRENFNHNGAATSIDNVMVHLSVTEMSNISDTSAGSILARSQLLTGQNSIPLPPAVLGANSKKYFALPPNLTTRWEQVVRPLLRAYDGAVRVAKVRSSNYTAYEAAFATLYRLHLETLAIELVAPDRSPEDYAQEQAKIGCGQAPPRADMRFRVEAIWASINIRFDLARVARTFLEKLKLKRDDTGLPVPENVLKTWADFITFIHESACSDSRMAIRLATESNSHRQIVRSTLLLLRATFEAFNDRTTQLATSLNPADSRRTLAEEALRRASEAKLMAASVCRNYREAFAGSLEQQEWLQTEFSSVVDVIVDKWNEQSRKLLQEPFYAPVELGELQQVLKAFTDGFLGFSTRGHFYTCPQGHIYVITECGQAMQRSVCPECGATIGGGNHSLDPSNRPSTIMEDMARGTGLPQNPWGPRG